MNNEKIYIGDGAYAQFDGYGFIVTTENGISVQNTIYFEPEVFQSFKSFYERYYPVKEVQT